MKALYARVLNRQTEHTDNYVVFEEDGKITRSMLPCTFFWLKYYGLENECLEHSSAWDDIWFQIVTYKDIEEGEKRNVHIYKKYYDLLNPAEVLQYKNLHGLGSFLEHYAHNRNIAIPLKRIEASIFNYHLDNPGYIETIGKFIYEITSKQVDVGREEYLEFALSKDAGRLEPYLYMKD